MLTAVARALEIRSRHGIEGVASEDEVDRAVAGAGFDLREDRPYEDRLYGRFFRGTVCVKRGLWPELRRVVKAHELGHGVLGHDTGYYLQPALGGEVPRGAAEIQAQIFAWTLLVGEPAPSADGLTAQMHAAHEAGVSLPFLCTAVSILAQLHDPVRGRPLRALC